MEVVPAINCNDLKCISERVNIAKKFSRWVHLDVSDGKFTPSKTWNNPAEPSSLIFHLSSLNLEVHLMVTEPEKVAEEWLKAGAKRLIVHLETIDENSFEEIRKTAEKYNAELMLSLRPETSAENLRPYFEKTLEFQILAVYPGPSGQKFLQLVLEKVKFLRRELPDAKIEVDGGINLETARLCKEAGADIVVSASYIFGNSDPESAYRQLKIV